MNELEQYVQEMMDAGAPETEIAAFIDQYDAEFGSQDNQTSVQESQQDAVATPEDRESTLLEKTNFAEIKRKEENGMPLTPEESNARQEVFAKAVTAIPGTVPMPEWMVGPAAAFGEGVANLASGTVKGLKSIGLYAKEKFDPDFAQRVKEDPTARQEYLNSITTIDERIDDFAGDLGIGKKQYDSSSITELAGRGEIGQAAALAAQQTVGAVPSVLATMSGWGGMVTLGVSAAGSSFDEDLERHPEESIDRLVGAAWAKGGVELASELVTRKIAMGAGLIMGKGQSVNAAKQFTEGALRRITKDATMEGLSEGAADTASKAIDTMVYGDEFDSRQAITDFLDNAIVGAALGGGVSSIGALNSANTIERAAAQEALKSQETQEVEDKAQAEINAIQEQKRKLDENTSEEESLTEQEKENSLLREVLDAREQELQSEVAAAKKADLDALNDMTEGEITRVAKAKDRARTAERAAKKETDPDKKQILENIVEQSKSQVTEVYDKVRNHENVVAEQEAINDEADQVIEEQQKIIKEEQKQEEPKKEKIEKAEAKIEEETTKKQQAAAAVETARPGYDHNLKRKRPEKESTESLIEKFNKLPRNKKGDLTPQANKYYSKIKKQESKLLNQATTYAFNNLTQQGSRATIDGKALTKEDVRKYVEDQFQLDVTEGRTPSLYNLVQRAKRSTLREFLPKRTYSKKNLTKEEKERFTRQEAQEKEAQAAIRPQETQLKAMERELADVKTPRSRRNELQTQVEILRDEIANAKAVAADASIVSLDAAVNAEGENTIADFVKDESGNLETAVKPVDQIVKAVPMDTKKVGDAVRDAISLGGVDIASPSSIAEIASDPLVAAEIDAATNPMTKSKKAVMDNAQTVIDMLPEAFKAKRALQSPADLDGYISGANQSRALGQVRDAMKAGIVEGFVEQAAQQGVGVNMTEYLESTKADQKAAVQSMVMHLNRMYPNIKFFMSKAKVAEELIEAGIDPGKADNIGGMLTPKGEIILNPDLTTMETPIHELGHVWAKGLRSTNLAAYNRGVELVKQTAEWKELEMKSKDPNSVYYNYGRTRLEEEGVATLIGLHGEMKFGNAQTAGEARSWIQEVMDWISEQIGFTIDKNTTLHDFLDHAVNEIVAGKATSPSQILVSEMSEISDIIRGEESIDRILSGNRLPSHSVMVGGKRVSFKAPEGQAEKIKRILSSQAGTIEFSEVADSQLERLKKDYARMKKAPRKLGDRSLEIMQRRIKQLERPKSLTEATKLADMMMLNPVLKNQIRAAKPADVKRYRTVNNDLQARKTVAGIMKTMAALPAAGRVEFANQLSRGIKSNMLAGQQNVAGFANSLIAKEILTESGIDFEGIDMNSNILSGVAQAMNKANIRGVFGENVNWAKVDYKGTDAGAVAANRGAIKAFFNTLAGLNKLDQIDSQTIAKIKNIWGAAGQHSLYRGATGSPKFFHRGAKRGKKAQDGFIREHVLPASQFFDEAFIAARRGKLDSVLPNLLDNYQLVILSKADDARVNQAGFKDRQPDVFGDLKDQKLGELPASYMRYFNGQVALNPTDYVDANGRSMASYMGLSPEAQLQLQQSDIGGIEFSESRAVNNATAENADNNTKEYKAAVRALNRVMDDKYLYKSASKYKKSRITGQMRDVIEATRKDFKANGKSLSLDDITTLTEVIKQRVKDDIKGKREARQKTIDQTRSGINDLIKKTSGIDVDNYDPNISTQKLRQARKWYNRLRPRSLADLIMPASNNDFYGLLYSLYPKGKAERQQAKQFIDKNVIKPLEDAGIAYAAIQDAMLGKMRNIKKNNDIKAKDLNAETGIELLNKKGEVSIPNMTADNVVKLYNYIKDPTLHKRLNDNGIDMAKMEEVMDYMEQNPKLKAYSDALVDTYRMIAPELAQKLKDTGRESFKTEIDPATLTEEQQEILNRIYPNGIPTQVAYTPLTLESQKDKAEDQNFDDLTSEGKFHMPTVMDGRLKKRSGGGVLNLVKSNTEQDLASYMEGPARTLAYLDFADSISAAFGGDQIKSMRDAYGPAWSDAMKDSVSRILTGRTAPSQTQEDVTLIDKWIRRSVGGIMFFNGKSALLQLISSANYLADDPRVTVQGMKSKNKDKVKEFLKNSPWMKLRGEGKIDVAMDEVFSQRGQNWMDELIQKGYSLTKWGDKTAIASGGAYYMAGLYDQYIKEGMSEEDAMDRAYRSFVAKAEETQQSTRQERLGHQQTTKLGKLVLAFANTQQQYNRKMSRAMKDIAAGEDIAGNVGTILYYGGIQNAMFTTAQKLVMFGLDLEDEEDQKWASSAADTILRGIGIWGAAISTVKNVAMAAMKKRVKEKDVYQALVNTAPALGTRARDVSTLVGAKKLYARSEWADDNQDMAIFAYKAAALANLVGLPGDRVVKLLENVSDVMASDLDMIERMARLVGWSRYELDAHASRSPMKKIIEKVDSESDVLGRANKDGSIEINPNLPPAQRKAVMAHEKEHARQMKSGELDYTDNSLTWKGKKYDRKNGKIYYNGKWIKEGSKEFPWEAGADKAEAKASPLKVTTEPEKKTPGWDKAIEEGLAFNKSWYNNPQARQMLEQQAPRFQGKVDKYLDRMGEAHFEHSDHLEPGEVAEYWRNRYADPSKGEHEHNVSLGPGQTTERPGLVAHELSHVAGWDYDLGKKILEVTGGPDTSTRYGRYLSSPDEAYGNLQELRHIFQLKPDQRNLTTEDIDKLQKEKGNEDTKAYIKAFGVEGVKEALNKVADAKFNKGIELKLQSYLDGQVV